MINSAPTLKTGIIIACIISLFIPFVSQGSNDSVSNKTDSNFHRRINILPVPAFGYSPETSSYIGAVALMTLHLFNDSLTRTSNAKAEFNYTWKKQYITDVGWEIYTKKEKFYFKGRLTFSRYPDLYYGIGENTPLSNETKYDSRRTVAEFNVLKSISHRCFLGIVLRYSNYNILQGSSDSNLVFDELTSSKSAGGGLRLMTDNRNNLLNTTDGNYSDISVSYNHSDNRDYVKFGLDLRMYNTFNKKHTLALRFLGLMNLNYTPPFYDMSLLGGDNQVRGYLLGRYRDNNLVTLQSEFRSIIYRRWGYAIFGGISGVASSIKTMEFLYPKINYGAGLRFMIDRKEKTNLRLDYARGNDGSDGFYISFGEAF